MGKLITIDVSLNKMFLRSMFNLRQKDVWNDSVATQAIRDNARGRLGVVSSTCWKSRFGIALRLQQNIENRARAVNRWP